MEDAAALAAQAFEDFKAGRFLSAAERMDQALTLDPDTYGQAGLHVSAAHAYLLGARWDRIGYYVPKNMNSLATSGWLTSLSARMPVAADGSPIPWYTYPAIEFLEDKIDPAWSVLEWGSGFSTLWWANRVRQVLSVEQDKEWYDALAARIPANVRLRLEPEHAGYAGVLAGSGERFDLIVVDGGPRGDCVQAVIDTGAEPLLLVVDNSDLVEMADPVLALGKAGWLRVDFYGLIPSYTYKNCTSVFFKDPAVLNRALLPSRKVSCLGPTAAQAQQQGM